MIGGAILPNFSAPEAVMNDDRSWSDAQRLESYAGELRLNLIRLVAIAGFYGYHLLDAYVLRPDDPAIHGIYHARIAGSALIWAIGAVALQLYLVNRWVPAALKYVATAWDLVMITVVLMIGKDPYSLLTVLYLLVVAAAALRLCLVLVYAATLGAMAGFLLFHGYIRFWLALPPDQRLSHAQQTLFLLAVAVTGLIAGQVVRQARRLVQGHAVRVIEPEER
jgi:hypothetical protein